MFHTFEVFHTEEKHTSHDTSSSRKEFRSQNLNDDFIQEDNPLVYVSIVSSKDNSHLIVDKLSESIIK